MTKPRLSPNLAVWRTAVNSKLLITGSIGIDPLLVKEKSNFPRFKILMKTNTGEGEIIQKVKEEVVQLEKILGRKLQIPKRYQQTV